jgi:hypothetical protein
MIMAIKKAPSKKVTMVAPPPAKPLDLTVLLRLLGNDRPYTIIATAVDHWIVHFNGDTKPSAIMQVGGKWKIVQAK